MYDDDHVKNWHYSTAKLIFWFMVIPISIPIMKKS